MSLLAFHRARSRGRTRKESPSPVQRALGEFFRPDLSRHTVQAYRIDLSRFAEYVDAPLEAAVERLCAQGCELAQRWLDSLVSEESLATRRRRASTLRALYRACARNGLCEGELHVDVPKTSPDVRNDAR